MTEALQLAQATAPEGAGLPPRLLVRLAGEVGTKSPRTRRRFLRVLVRNLRLALRAVGVPAGVRSQWSRVVVDAADPARAGEALGKVFGVGSVSRVVEVSFSGLEDLVARLAPVFSGRVAGRTFAVRARRFGEHPFGSLDVERALGTALLPGSAGVNLRDPEVTAVVEVNGGRAFAVLETFPGPGGLPLGSGGRAVSLFSGGFDSPVATWSLMRRGVLCELLVCDLGGCGQVGEALSVARALALRWAAGLAVRAHVVDLAPAVAVLRERVEPRLRQLLLKRAMYRAGAALAEVVGAEALVTGESVGQVSTQTLRNLAVSEAAVDLPVLRPLVGTDKDEIMARARDIGTYAASSEVQEHCSIASGPVETWAAPEEVAAAEASVVAGGIDDAWIRGQVARRWVVDLRRWSAPGPSELVVDEVPEGAVVVDVREPGEGPPVGDRQLPFSRAAEWLGELDPAATYVLVCTSGQRSLVAAEALAARGVRAYSLDGGARRLARRAG